MRTDERERDVKNKINNIINRPSIYKGTLQKNYRGYLKVTHEILNFVLDTKHKRVFQTKS